MKFVKGVHCDVAFPLHSYSFEAVLLLRGSEPPANFRPFNSKGDII